MKKALFLGLLAAVVVTLTFCKHKADLTIAPPPPTPLPASNCSPDTVYFENTVLPILTSNCAKSGCHDAETHEHGVQMTDYWSILEEVRPYDPNDSELYEVLFSNGEERMPPDAPLSDEQKSAIYYWILQGALDNRCNSTDCDTTNVTYTATLKPLLDLWCTGCHGGASPAAGISLGSYNELSAVADGGRLIGAIRHQAGFYPMPKGGSFLSECQIREFELWISLGKPQ